MLRISESEAEKHGFSFSPEGEKRVLDICREAVGSKEAGNGRFCRNLVENAILNYASRVYGEDSGIVEKNYVLIAEDITRPEGCLTQEKVTNKLSMGFHA